jgi:hypothetical protein
MIMTNTKKALFIVLLTAYPLYGEAGALAPVVPIYDQPASRMGSEPVPLNTNPYLVPANRNPYFDDPSMRTEGVPTGNPELSNVYSRSLEGNNAGGPNFGTQDHVPGTTGTSGQ